MTHASLFSGIGGAELAASWMGWTNLFHCEINPFGRKVLEHWFPNSISYDDITKTDFTMWRGKVDVLTGGFPCQPFSLAGRRKGAEDDRYLWPEMLRAIGEIQPAWVVGENVAGLATMVQPGETADMGRTDDLFEENHLYRTVQEYTLDAIIRSLESIGYAVQSFLVPACAVGAPHRRDRLWIVAHRTDAGAENKPARTVHPHTARPAADTIDTGVRTPQYGREQQGQTPRQGKDRPLCGSGRPCDQRTAANTVRGGRDERGGDIQPQFADGQRTEGNGSERYAPDTDSDGCGRRTDKSQPKSRSRRQTDARPACKTTTPPLGLLKTPAARDWKGANGPHGFETLPGQIQNMEKKMNIHKHDGRISHLSPLFVEEMMGYPLTYLVLPFLNPSGERKQ